VTAAALTIPGVDVPVWTRRRIGDLAARTLAARHYTGTGRLPRTVGAPGRRLVFVTPCERAAWVSHYPAAAYALDGLDAWRCSLFRNEGAGLSSALIRAAMAATLEAWGQPPPDGWLTYVDPTRIRSSNPGACFKAAGWRLDRGYVPWDGRLLRLRA
jgi:hypothetical protein